jgi:hypothetical protein
MTAPRRWSFSFAVVTVLACWLGWELWVVRERNRIRTSLDETGNSRPASDQWTFVYAETVNPSALRLLLGDRRFNGAIEPRRLSVSETQAIKRAFPTVQIDDDPDSKDRH